MIYIMDGYDLLAYYLPLQTCTKTPCVLTTFNAPSKMLPTIQHRLPNEKALPSEP